VGWRALLAVAGTLLYGILDEVHQSHVPNRVASVSDVLADAVGAVLVVVIWCRLFPYPGVPREQAT
jgi:VanZ family protein